MLELTGRIGLRDCQVTQKFKTTSYEPTLNHSMLIGTVLGGNE